MGSHTNPRVLSLVLGAHFGIGPRNTYQRYVFRIQIRPITNCIPLQLQFKLLVGLGYLEYSYIVEINGLHDDTSVS